LRAAFLLVIGASFWAFSGWQIIHVARYGSVLAGPKGVSRYYSFEDSLFWFLLGLSGWLAFFALLTVIGVLSIRRFLRDRWLRQFRRDHSQPW